MVAERIIIHPVTPQPAKIARAVQILREGGIIIYPTDTVYGMGCDIHQARAVERLCRINDINPKKINLSFICHDLSHISEYTRNLPTQVFKVMKKALPGPYTFLLPASQKVPKMLNVNKNSVGIRVPDNLIVREIVKELGNPVLNASVKDPDEVVQYTTDPDEIYERYKKLVDALVDGGYGGNTPSTILDCQQNEIVLLRQGLGSVEEWV